MELSAGGANVAAPPIPGMDLEAHDHEPGFEFFHDKSTFLFRVKTHFLPIGFILRQAGPLVRVAFSDHYHLLVPV
jgi:hypothetical protein